MSTILSDDESLPQERDIPIMEDCDLITVLLDALAIEKQKKGVVPAWPVDQSGWTCECGERNSILAAWCRKCNQRKGDRTTPDLEPAD